MVKSDMIWHRLHLMFRAVMQFILPLPASAFARIDPNSPCPSCGAALGIIRCVERGGKILVQHSCGVCGGRWHEEPIVKVNPSTVWPSVPRSDLEVKEELSIRGMTILSTRPQPVAPVEVRMPPPSPAPTPSETPISVPDKVN